MTPLKLGGVGRWSSSSDETGWRSGDCELLTVFGEPESVALRSRRVELVVGAGGDDDEGG